jgi:hypothetical protein
MRADKLMDQGDINGFDAEACLFPRVTAVSISDPVSAPLAA